MTDIVKDLRQWFRYDGCGPKGPLAKTCKDAADELDRLRAENENRHLKEILLLAQAAELRAENERLRQELKDVMHMAEASGFDCIRTREFLMNQANGEGK